MDDKKGFILDLYQPTLCAYCRLCSWGDYGGERVSRDCDVQDIDDCTGPWVDVRRWIDEQVR